MSTRPVSASPLAPSPQEKVLIVLAPKGCPADRAIRRIGRFGSLGELSLELIISEAVATHEKLKDYGNLDQYQAEDSTVHEVERMRRGGYAVLVNDAPLPAVLLQSCKVAEFIREVDEPVARYGVQLWIEEVAGPTAPVAAPQAAPSAEASPVAAAQPALADTGLPTEAEVTAMAEAGTAVVPEPAAAEVAPMPEEREEKAPRLSKYEQLTEQYRGAVRGLNFDGLFVSNIRARNEMDPRLLPFMHQKDISRLLMKANGLLQEGRCDKAIELYELLATSDPQNADYQFLGGKALLFIRDFEAGLVRLRNAYTLGHDEAGSVARRVESFHRLTGSYPASSEGLRNLLGEPSQ